MAKATDAFRTIGEVSDELDVAKHVLRFWEGKFPQLKPMKRGGGRRFYRPEDVALLRGIHHLLHSAGYTIKGVQRIMRESGVEAVKSASAGTTASIGRTQTTAPPRAPAPPLRKSGRAPAATVAAATVPEPLRSHIEKIIGDLEDCLAMARHGASAAQKPSEASNTPVSKTKR